MIDYFQRKWHDFAIMTPPSTASQTTWPQPVPSLKSIALALSQVARWQMLAELSLGEGRMVSELAKVAGCSPGMASRHMTRMRDAGLVVCGRGNLYQIPKQYLPSPGERVVDYGHCILHLDAAHESA